MCSTICVASCKDWYCYGGSTLTEIRTDNLIFNSFEDLRAVHKP